jgi:3-dehydroquinate synthase
MNSIVTVPLPQNPYEIDINAGNLDRLGEKMAGLKLGQKVMVVSNPTVFGHYGDRSIASIQRAGFEVSPCIVPDGETHKNLATIERIYDRAHALQLERSSTLVALGGGVIGDMTGFAAATWNRGMNFVQVPTTLLAMVDASIGGKTGVNHPQGKNKIGAFYQPRLVAIDPQVLTTLPVREFQAGMAEVIKYGIIWDCSLFERLESAPSLAEIGAIDPDLVADMILSSCQAKADVVLKDERESHLRGILNYGHTIGHALESITNYSTLNHGEGVGIGMVVAGKLAVQEGLWTEAESIRQDRVIAKAGLAIDLPPGLDLARIVHLTHADKKVEDGKVRYILPTQIGYGRSIGDRLINRPRIEILNAIGREIEDDRIDRVLHGMAAISQKV